MGLKSTYPREREDNLKKDGVNGEILFQHCPKGEEKLEPG